MAQRVVETPYRFLWERAFRSARVAEGSNGTSTLAVGFAFATWANPDGSDVYPSYERVAEGLGVSPRTVSRAAHRLVAEGWLAVVRERQPPYNMVTRYRLNIPPPWRIDPTAEAQQETKANSQPVAPVASTRQHGPQTGTSTRPGTTTGLPDSHHHDRPDAAAIKDDPWAGLHEDWTPATQGRIIPDDSVRGPNGELPPSFWGEDDSDTESVTIRHSYTTRRRTPATEHETGDKSRYRPSWRDH